MLTQMTCCRLSFGRNARRAVCATVNKAQLAPFHISASGPLPAKPAATQNVELGHETPFSPALLRGMDGVLTMLHCPACRMITNGRCDTELLVLPTATHSPAAKQATSLSTLFAPRTLGMLPSV